MKKNNTKELHWVFICRNKEIRYFLGDADNKMLSFPMVRDLSKEEMASLEEAGVICERDLGDFTFFDCYPAGGYTEISVTAPMYVEEKVNGNVEYCKLGSYTGINISPEDYKKVNEAVKKYVPEHKIHIPGNYA